MENVIEFMLSENVISTIDSKGTKITSITFLKSDGSLRKAVGLFKPSSHIIGSERGYRQGQDMKEKGLIPFFDLKKKAWISFYKNKVLNIK